MKKLKFEGPQDIWDIVKRRKWLMMVPFLLFTIVMALVVYAHRTKDGKKEYLLPDIYQSETMIIVEDQKIPASMVAVLDDVGTLDRLTTLQQQVLSRSNLASVVQAFNLYDDFRVKLTEDQKILALSRAIKVDVGLTQRETSAKVAYFKLSYENRDPYFAMRVTNRLAGLFIDYDYRARIKKINDTIDFLTSEVNLMERTLSEHEDREREFRQAHLEELPEVADRNMRLLEVYQMKEKSATEALDRAEARLQTLKRELATTPEFLEKKASQVRPGSGGRADEDTPERIDEELRAAQAKFSLVQSRYTDKHPDYQEAQNRLRDLERMRREAGGKAPRSGERGSSSLVKSEIKMEANPQYQKLKQEEAEVMAEVALRRKERQDATGEAARFERHLQAAPQRGMELSAITRDLGTLRARYEKLRNALTEAKMTGSMEARQKGESFRIQDPASLPTSPGKPKRLIYVLIGAAIGLGLGVLLAILRELFDEKIRTRAEIEGPLGLPVLVEIPEILNAQELQLKRMKKVLAFSISIMLFVGVIAVTVQLFFRNYQVIIEYVILSGLI